MDERRAVCKEVMYEIDSHVGNLILKIICNVDIDIIYKMQQKKNLSFKIVFEIQST